MHTVDLVCFGELLWDVLPTKKVAGGAPFNIVNRANALGIHAEVISSVGNDELGRELVDLVAAKGNNTSYIQKHPSLPTSTVQIEVGPKGEPHYDIVHPVAWDDIQSNDALVDLVSASRSFVYSSLGLRDRRSREVLFRLLDHAALAVCDINLREGHYEEETIRRMVDRADILRMNEYELLLVSRFEGLESLSTENKLAGLQKRYGLDTVIVTLGAEGALSYTGNHFYRQEVFPVDVRDTIGSGDAFLASYLTKKLEKCPESECLRFGCAVGALTASKDGGTPHISAVEISEMLGST